MAALSTADAAPTGGPIDGAASVVDDANAESSAGDALGSVSAAIEPLSDSDTTTSEGDREYVAGCFEGPEKNIEVCFTPDIGHPNGCRELSRDALDAICAAARCTILTSVSNAHLDAYVLSESSLFVYRNKMALKVRPQLSHLAPHTCHHRPTNPSNNRRAAPRPCSAASNRC